MTQRVDRSVDTFTAPTDCADGSLSRAEHWQTAWTGRAHQETSWYSDDPMRALDELAVVLASDDSVIDVGGGSSLLVDRLLDRGLADVTVLDIAAASLDGARQRLGQRAASVTWVHADVVLWAPERTYSLWHDRAAFHFLTDPDDRRAYVSAASQAVAPAGSLVLSTFAHDGPEQCSGLAVQRWTADDLAAQFALAFEPMSSKTSVHTTPWGSEQRFTTVVMRRSTSDSAELAAPRTQ